MTPALPDARTGLVPVGQATLIGTVLEFDDARGIGTVGCGERAVPFHCTAITDGSRHIDPGTVVAVRIGAGRLGRVEARSVRPLPGVATGPDGVAPAGSTNDHRGAHSPRPEVYPSVSVPSPVRPAGGPTVGGSADTPVAPSGTDTGPPPAPVPAGEADTPPSGSSPVPSAPTVAPAVAPAPSPSGTTPSFGSGTGVVADDDDSAPRPDFWSPFSRSPAGPPPTWSTPVTPREPPADGG
jgi:cold shock CspA family protein